MEKLSETSFGTPIQSETTLFDSKTPNSEQQTDQNCPNSCTDSQKPSTPDRLKVPKAFKYPERYTSPTDLVVSPVSKVLARSRKSGTLLPPTKIQPKMQDSTFEEVGLFSNLKHQEQSC
ncbi:uncharacterized protein LOC132267432 [Cornus florida]|uniref:uncharacterized protein LOC132267432 n=1 Tax=Cornus florida TaxID=4283 RepID=UPI00289C4629|nr:uncharacterized protein LOC132267432 [Cornus florida]